MINLIINLFRIFIIVDIVKIKRINIILKKKINSNKKVYIKDNIKSIFFVRR